MSRRAPVPLVILAAFAAAPSSPAAPTPAPVLTNDEIEELAFRTYLYAQIGDKPNALATGGRVLEVKPGHPGVLLALCSIWEADGDTERLQDTALRLLAALPDNDQALAFKASTEVIMKRYAQARFTTLENRRHNFTDTQEFPYHAVLATAAGRAGDWRTSIYSQRQLVEKGGTDELMANNRRAYDDLLGKHVREASVGTEFATAPGRYSLFSTHAAYESQVTIGTRASAELATLHASLANAAGLAAAGKTRDEARVALDYVAGPTWAFTAGVGVSSAGDANGRAAAVHHTTAVRKFGVAGEYNTPADDDASYTIANIRQSKLLASYEDLWTDRTGGSFSGGLRSLHTADEAPRAPGWVFSGEIFHHSRQRIPRFTPYLQTLWLLNSSNAPVESRLTALRNDGKTSAIARAFDLQKAGLRTEVPLKRKVTLSSDAFLGTSLMNGGFLYGASAAVLWRPIKTLTLHLGAGWDKGTLFGELPYGIARATASANWVF